MTNDDDHDLGICRPGVSIPPFFFYLPSALPLSSLCHRCTFPRDLWCAALCRVRGESLCSTCVKGPFLHRWGISFGIIQKFNVLYFIYQFDHLESCPAQRLPSFLLLHRHFQVKLLLQVIGSPLYHRDFLPVAHRLL